ncbi:MAG: hypothetical protein NC299_15250 [Lachnospiraceae bacterium]|nr:hypothetical protein [Lachnospiraceae bacterium]
MSMRALEDLRETLCKELDEISKKREINTQILENIHKLTDSIKNIDKIIMLENGETEYSQAGERGGMRGYNSGNSYANRGQHYVRGHYSRDGGNSSNRYSRDGYSQGGYSRDSGEIMETLRDMMDGMDDKGREAIKRCLRELGE